MEKQVEQDDVRRFKRDTVIFTVLIILTVVSAVPLFLYLELSGDCIMAFNCRSYDILCNATRTNKKGTMNIQTYREILAFMEDKENEQ